MIVAFWISLFLIIYAFVGYGILLCFLVKIKRFFVKPFVFKTDIVLPSVTLLIAAYNEEDIISEKILNTLEINYPKDKIQILFITDGSTDQTAVRVREFPEVVLLHEDIRAGKMAAIKRAMPFVLGDITVFTDANTFLNRNAVLELVKHYQNFSVGAVAGEKRILMQEKADASSAGESFYWKYESRLKKWDYDLYSNVGAAGELFSIRTALYQPIESDTIIDDHMIAMRIAERGYVIAYEPEAYAVETASANTKEELKRKIRIAAGGMQSILRLKKAANPFFYPVLTFQYISHRVLRWTVIPVLLIMVFILNGILAFQTERILYQLLFFLQVVFYSLGVIGFYFEQRNIKIKSFFIPYYFCLMNYAVIAGIIRFFKKKQSAAWEKSQRKAYSQ